MCVYWAIICINMLEKENISFSTLTTVNRQYNMCIILALHTNTCKMEYNLRMIISYEDDCLMSPVAVSSFIFFHHLFLFLSACCFCSYVPWNSLTFLKLSIKPKNRNCFFLLLTAQLIHSIFFIFLSFSIQYKLGIWYFTSIRYKTKTMSIKHFSKMIL